MVAVDVEGEVSNQSPKYIIRLRGCSACEVKKRSRSLKVLG